jgi:DNA-binding MarR family transcriptional regulator
MLRDERSDSRLSEGGKTRRGAGEASSREPRISLGASLMTLANLMRRTTASRFQRLFGLSLVDGWVVTRLGPSARISLDELAYRSGLAKSQMSRSVTSMVKRKLVSRTRNPRNNSEVVLTLTAEGRAMHGKITAAFPGFNQLLTKGLADAEVARLTEIVEHLIANSRRNLQDEQKYGRETLE